MGRHRRVERENKMGGSDMIIGRNVISDRAVMIISTVMLIELLRAVGLDRLLGETLRGGISERQLASMRKCVGIVREGERG
jgi:hypothetical protein